METKFKVLRVIGTLWKVLAWIALIVGIVFAVGVLLAGILGAGMPRMFLRDYGPMMDRMPWAAGLAGGIIGFFAALIGSVVYFLLLYAAGELVYLLLAIEENTRATTQLLTPAQEPETFAPPPDAPPAV